MTATDKKRITEIEGDLYRAFKAIDTLTERLIDLARVENNFIQKADDLSNRQIQIIRNNKELEEQFSRQTTYFTNYYKFPFRYKWMQKLFFKK